MEPIINFLYCIDRISISNNPDMSDRIDGWLLCSNKIRGARVSEGINPNIILNVGMPRPDVALHFIDFPDNDKCGFSIIAENGNISLHNEFNLELEIEVSSGNTKSIEIALNLNASGIQEIEVDDNKELSDSQQKHIEAKFIKTLKTHPWLTIRMDIINKCNLRCIMCHYKEEEIHSQPLNLITASELKHQLQDIAPFVKHIMLSCGFEPLMSKHFSEIIIMLRENYPHLEIGLCTNGMLLDSKIRKILIENNVTHVIFSFDGVTKNTLEKIRLGADYNKIIGNIKALRDLKRKYKRNFPLMFMDFVLMKANIHEAPAFVRMCAELGFEIIDFRHLVGNIYFKVHDEMLIHEKEKYNYFRQLIIDESKKYPIDVRLPEPFETEGSYIPDVSLEIDLSDFDAVISAEQTLEVIPSPDIVLKGGNDTDFHFLSNLSCLRPFNEIMIIDQEKILPCSYYNDSMGKLDDNNTLHSIFFNEKYQKVRRNKILNRFDLYCNNCPIISNLLPTDIIK